MSDLPAYTEVVPYDPDPPPWARDPGVTPGHLVVPPVDAPPYDPPAPQLVRPDTTEED